jgi:hypothetical protein
MDTMDWFLQQFTGSRYIMTVSKTTAKMQSKKEEKNLSQLRWLVTLATWEAVRRIVVQGHPDKSLPDPISANKRRHGDVHLTS